MPPDAGASPNICFALPTPLKKSPATPRPAPSSTAPCATGAPAAILRCFPPSILSAPYSRKSPHPAALKPATTGYYSNKSRSHRATPLSANLQSEISNPKSGGRLRRLRSTPPFPPWPGRAGSPSGQRPASALGTPSSCSASPSVRRRSPRGRRHGVHHQLAPPACPSRLPYPRPRVEKLRECQAHPAANSGKLRYARPCSRKPPHPGKARAPANAAKAEDHPHARPPVAVDQGFQFREKKPCMIICAIASFPLLNRPCPRPPT